MSSLSFKKKEVVPSVNFVDVDRLVHVQLVKSIATEAQGFESADRSRSSALPDKFFCPWTSASCPRDRDGSRPIPHSCTLSSCNDNGGDISLEMSDLPFDTNDPAVRDFLTLTRYACQSV